MGRQKSEPPSRERVEAALRMVVAENRPHMVPGLCTVLTLDCDVELVTDVLCWLIERDPFQMSSIARLPARVLRRLHARFMTMALPAPPETISAHHSFPRVVSNIVSVRSLIEPTAPDAVIEAQWDQAQTLIAATTRWWNDLRKSPRRLAPNLADDPRALAAIVSMLRAGLDNETLLAILASSASAEARAALASEVALVLERNNLQELARLQELSKFATPAALPLIHHIEARLAAELDLGRMSVWFGSPDHIELACTLSALPAGPTARIELSNTSFRLVIEEPASGRQTTVVMREPPTTYVAERDDFELGACLAMEMPAYLARAADRLGLTWDFERCVMRHNRRQAFVRWLKTGRFPSRKSGLDPRYSRNYRH